jgi:hypothetical protein
LRRISLNQGGALLMKKIKATISPTKFEAVREGTESGAVSRSPSALAGLEYF